MKDEIYVIINEVVNTSSILGQTLCPEWCDVLRLHVELHHLQSNYRELYDRHMENPHDIGPVLYTKMIEKYSSLRHCYLDLVKDHAILKDDLERLTRQVTAGVSDLVVGRFSFN